VNIHLDPETHTYLCDGVVYPSVTQILQDEGFIDATWFTEYARDRGTLVHRITHWYDTGELDMESVDPALGGYLEGWIRFREESGFDPQIIERPLASHTHRFAGTPDRIGVLNGDLAIPDIKSGAVQAWTGLQLAGYEILYGQRVNRFGVQLTEDGKYKLIPFTDRNDRGVFMAALSTWWWKECNQKRRETA